MNEMIYYSRGEITAILGTLKLGIKRDENLYLIQEFSVYHRRYLGDDGETFNDVIIFAGKGMNNLEGSLLTKEYTVDIRDDKTIVDKLDLDTLDYMKISGLINWMHYNEFKTHTVELRTTLHNAKNYINAINDAIEVIKKIKEYSVSLNIKEELQLQFVLAYQKKQK